MLISMQSCGADCIGSDTGHEAATAAQPPAARGGAGGSSTCRADAAACGEFGIGEKGYQTKGV